MRSFLGILYNRLTLLAVLVLLQLIGLVLLIVKLSEYVVGIYFFLLFLSVVLVVYLSFLKRSPSYTTAWISIILIFPVIGGVFYLIFGNKKVPKALSRFSQVFKEEHPASLRQDEKVLDSLKETDQQLYKQANYLWQNSFYPLYQNTKVTYFPDGESKFLSLLSELRKAQEYIFLEYFIIEEGYMWNSILAILIEKAAANVDVRVIYDDVGCINKLPVGYDKYLNSLGIKCQIFNRLRPRLIIQMNNRDHRKIAIIDGKKAYFGGINLADEYINRIERFGYWKDTAVLVEGEAVKSAVLMFLQFWNFNLKTEEPIESYYRNYQVKADGYVQLFSDSPTDDEEISETVHLNMINLAKNYVYIYTPYLIPSYEMIQALTIAAKNGIDVRIIVPHIPDKWYVHLVSQSNYRHLLKSGVKIYEYTPGFIHGKNIIADDEIAIVGSSNMDFRSYYLHFESGALLFKNQAILDIKADFLDSIEKSEEIFLANWDNYRWYKKVLMAVLSLFSYLM